MNNWILIVLAVLIFLYVSFLIITKQWTKLRSIAYALMLGAERLYTTEEGKRKFEMVLRRIYDLMPVWMSMIFSDQKIRQILQAWYNKAKDCLDDGKINGSIKDE